ncbi:ATP-binding cassette domain-containing protein [Streptomyces globisporus]
MTAESLSSPHEPSGGPLLSLRGISKSFGAVAALTDVDLDVSAGQVVALVGDNGAGKSTLVKVLSGVHQPDAGTVGFDHGTVSLSSPATAQRLGIATVFQDLALCENLNVVENLFLGRELRGLRLDEVTMEVRSLALLGELSAKIPSVRAPVAALSGGQRQTVAIARTLLGDPKVIILDEPTAALGVAQTAEVLNLIERLRERGLGVIMVSHNMADVRAVADTVAVLRLGRNNGVFDAAEATAADLVAAITGATDNVVSRRAGRERAGDDRAGRGTDGRHGGSRAGTDRHAGGRAADDPAFGDRAVSERAADSGTESAHQGDAS